jgi:hypothetical protein
MENNIESEEELEIDESILELVYKKNLEKNDALLDLEITDNTIKRIKSKNKISTPKSNKLYFQIENVNKDRKFNPRLPPYFSINKN